MGATFVKHLESANYNRKLFYLDRGAEDLPEIINHRDIMPGSECRSLTTGERWILNTHIPFSYASVMQISWGMSIIRFISLCTIWPRLLTWKRCRKKISIIAILRWWWPISMPISWLPFSFPTSWPYRPLPYIWAIRASCFTSAP